ncbi:MAG: alpha/beta hydrolase [Candidatus Velthaea sp.]|jgi:putative phosphoribosyl transferase
MNAGVNQRIEREIRIAAGGEEEILGTLCVPPGALGLVIFAHGSGSGRFSPRNRHVAAVLERAGLATLLLDLLTAREEAIDAVDASLRFDIVLLSARLALARYAADEWPQTRGLRIGFFGASTGAAAAIVAAAHMPGEIAAIVSRGGRPDLARDALRRVDAPTLFIVGSADPEVLELNEQAQQRMRNAPGEIAIVRGATHLFEEPGTLEEVARLARDFFLRYCSD